MPLEFAHEMEPVALMRALYTAKFESEAPFEPGGEWILSPFTSAVMRRLGEMQGGFGVLERDSEAAERVLEIHLHRLDQREWWDKLDIERQRGVMRDVASPYELDAALADELIAEADGTSRPEHQVRLRVHSAEVGRHGVPGGGWGPGGVGIEWSPIEDFEPEDPRSFSVEVLVQLQGASGERAGSFAIAVVARSAIEPGWIRPALVIERWSAAGVLAAIDAVLEEAAGPSLRSVLQRLWKHSVDG